MSIAGSYSRLEDEEGSRAMGQLTVDPRAVESASAALRSASDHGMSMLARAIVTDVQAGDGGAASSDTGAGFGTSLPHLATLPLLVEAICERAEQAAAGLGAAADGYRRTDWLVRVALAGQE